MEKCKICDGKGGIVNREERIHYTCAACHGSGVECEKRGEVKIYVQGFDPAAVLTVLSQHFPYIRFECMERKVSGNVINSYRPVITIDLGVFMIHFSGHVIPMKYIIDELEKDLESLGIK